MPARSSTRPLPNERLILVHFGELWLKGKNRSFYLESLMQNLRAQLRGSDCRIERQYDRVIIRLTPKSDLDRIKASLSNLFGISNFEIAYVTKPELREIVSFSVKLLKRSGAKNVKIEAHRTYKQLDFDSNDIIKRVSDAIDRAGINPELHGYDTMLYVNVTRECAYVFTEKVKGLGGLPVGSGGKCVVLLSGGIDSPVAAWYAMKRGMLPVYVHIHAFGSADAVDGTKIPTLIKTLSRYNKYHKAYYVPSHVFDAAAVSARAGRYSLTLLKNFMLSVAERVAKEEGARLIFTGEALGQVASQTSENIASEEYGTKLPIIRPLAGLDKEEIIAIARSIGTYSDSVSDYKDVCAMTCRNPRLRVHSEDVASFRKSMRMGTVVSRSLKLAKVVTE